MLLMTRLSIAACILYAHLISAQQAWYQPDNMDDITARMERVNHDNCAVIDRNQLFLPMSTVSHIPDVKTLDIDPIHQNRTNLLQIHNVALNRAFFFSFILQRAQDEAEPGFMYYMLSAAADVSANPHINSSAIYYSPNRAFTPSYNGFFNKTMPLFAPRAYRTDDFNDPFQLKGISTMNTISVTDLGAIRSEMRDSNYTSEVYKINEWYLSWLPDLTTRQDSKPTYSAQISHANGTNETFVFHGPPGASDEPGPVKWHRPYYDCGRSNKWLIGASVPIADLFPRHTGWRHIETPIHVAASVVEMDFDRLDINQCAESNGNEVLNYFSDTAKCKKDTTSCQPVHGYGLRRGGYTCRCKPGYRLPKQIRGPYLGELVERASDLEYKQSFSCVKIDNLAVKTQNVQPLSDKERNKIIGRISTATGVAYNISHDRLSSSSSSSSYANSGSSSVHAGQSSIMTLEPLTVASGSKKLEVNRLAEQIRKPLSAHECQVLKNLAPNQLKLPGNVAFGKEQQFASQARAALRIAHFVSSFLQIVDPVEVFAEFRVPDKPLTRDQVIGEALSALIGDRQIQGIGVWFDRNKFQTASGAGTNSRIRRDQAPFFGPYAYRLERDARKFYVVDKAATHSELDESHYSQHELFHQLKTRWMTGVENLDTYTLKANIRYNSSGLNLIKYDKYPLQYQVAQLEHGHWSAPFHECGEHNQWLISYAAPFFGWDKLKLRVEFYGIVLVNVKLADLDVNQCDGQQYHVSNAFKSTHKCDRHSTRCVPLAGRKFDSGGYKCECQQGYEYPFNSPTTYIDGQILEAEYMNVLQNKPSRFDSLVCRLAHS